MWCPGFMGTKVMQTKVKPEGKNIETKTSYVHFADYLELECLLSHFDDPCIMDVKMGTRAYLKNEVSLENKIIFEFSPSSAKEPDTQRGSLSKDGGPGLPGTSPRRGQTTGCHKGEVPCLEGHQVLLGNSWPADRGHNDQGEVFEGLQGHLHQGPGLKGPFQLHRPSA